MSDSTPRLLFDVTRLIDSGLHTGIQRVVRCLFEACALAQPAQVVPVLLREQACLALPCLPPHPMQTLDGCVPPLPVAESLQARSGDVLLMCDAAWYFDPWPAVEALKRRGVRIWAMVHDLLPLQRPEWFRDALQPRFVHHLQQLSRHAEHLLVPTHVVAGHLRHWLAQQRVSLPVSLLPHGGDFYNGPTLHDGHPALASLPTPNGVEQPLYLMLGTLEPRKNHALALDACERLWAAGSPVRLLLIGQAGWRVDELLQRLERHPERQQRLFHAPRLSDPLLHWLLGQASALLYLSRDEGFGLPLLEAEMCGCPVIASDVPVLREAGGHWPHYVAPDDADALARQLRQPIMANGPARQRRWREVASELLALLEWPASPQFHRL